MKKRFLFAASALALSLHIIATVAFAQDGMPPPTGDPPAEVTAQTADYVVFELEGQEERFRLSPLDALTFAYRGRIRYSEISALARSIVNNVVKWLGVRDDNKHISTSWTRELLTREVANAIRLEAQRYDNTRYGLGILNLARSLGQAFLALNLSLGFFMVMTLMMVTALDDMTDIRARLLLSIGMWMVFSLIAIFSPTIVSLINGGITDVAKAICANETYYQCDLSRPFVRMVTIHDLHDPLAFQIFGDFMVYPLVILLQMARLAREVFGILILITAPMAISYAALWHIGAPMVSAWARLYFRYLILILVLAALFALLGGVFYLYGDVYHRTMTWPGFRRFVGMAIAAGFTFLVVMITYKLLIVDSMSDVSQFVEGTIRSIPQAASYIADTIRNHASPPSLAPATISAENDTGAEAYKQEKDATGEKDNVGLRGTTVNRSLLANRSAEQRRALPARRLSSLYTEYGASDFAGVASALSPARRRMLVAKTAAFAYALGKQGVALDSIAAGRGFSNAWEMMYHAAETEAQMHINNNGNAEDVIDWGETSTRNSGGNQAQAGVALLYGGEEELPNGGTTQDLAYAVDIGFNLLRSHARAQIKPPDPLLEDDAPHKISRMVLQTNIQFLSPNGERPKQSPSFTLTDTTALSESDVTESSLGKPPALELNRQVSLIRDDDPVILVGEFADALLPAVSMIRGVSDMFQDSFVQLSSGGDGDDAARLSRIAAALAMSINDDQHFQETMRSLFTPSRDEAYIAELIKYHYLSGVPIPGNEENPEAYAWYSECLKHGLDTSTSLPASFFAENQHTGYALADIVLAAAFAESHQVRNIDDAISVLDLMRDLRKKHGHVDVDMAEETLLMLLAQGESDTSGYRLLRAKPEQKDAKNVNLGYVETLFELEEELKRNDDKNADDLLA